MKLKLTRAVIVAVVPAFVVAMLYYLLLGHRRDYLGHYAAGYGGTLSALAVVLSTIPANRFQKLGVLSIVPCTLLCIAAGTVTEATVFRLAKFDEVDYCNQNLGAVVAGLVVLCLTDQTKPAEAMFKCLAVMGVLFLLIGAYFAFT